MHPHLLGKKIASTYRLRLTHSSALCMYCGVCARTVWLRSVPCACLLSACLPACLPVSVSLCVSVSVSVSVCADARPSNDVVLALPPDSAIMFAGEEGRALLHL